MVKQRVVVGAVGADHDAQLTTISAAKALRDEGREVVLVGFGQTPEMLVRTAIAEDAEEIVVAVPAEDRTTLPLIRSLLDGLGAEDLGVTPAGGPPDAPRSPG